MKKRLMTLLTAVMLAGPLAAASLDSLALKPADDISVREMFRETEGKILDLAILSSIETGYARDMIGGQNMVVAQAPMLYFTPYFTFDFGYVTGYDDRSRGRLMAGGSLRVNRLIEDAFSNKLSLVKSYIPAVDSTWSRLWFGPWVSKSISDFDSNLMAGVKGGLRW